MKKNPIGLEESDSFGDMVTRFVVQVLELPPLNSWPVAIVTYRIEPLLARIKEDRQTVLCPIVDAIMAETLEYSGNGGYNIGGFTWSLHFTWRDVPKRDLVSRKYTDPVG